MENGSLNPLLKHPRCRISSDNRVLDDDWIVIEEPLQIRIIWEYQGKTHNDIFTITMRTPGEDKQLALGLLLSEGIITSVKEILHIYNESENGEQLPNQLTVELNPAFPVNLKSLKRRLVSHSACGICGKTSLRDLELKQPPLSSDTSKFLTRNIVFQLSVSLKKQQQIFKYSGGIHAAGLFNHQGKLLHSSEDVGRHNALDKLIGTQLLTGKPAESQSILLTTGRASFEMVQKTLMAGYSVLVAVGAPTSLAINAAKRFNMSLIGFVSETKFNLYTGEWRFIDSPTL